MIAQQAPWPRRARVDQMTPAELAIREAIRVVEEAGADVRLTDAVILLQAARNSVADYVDGVDSRRFVTSTLPAPAAAMVLNAALTALESLQAQGYYLHRADGSLVDDKTEYVNLVTTALSAALVR